MERRLKSGKAVRAFYDMNQHPDGYRFLRLLDDMEVKDTEESALIGISRGWFPASVAKDYDGEGNVRVKFHGKFQDPFRLEGDAVDGLHWEVKPELVYDMKTPAPKMQLSLIVLRFQKYWPSEKGSRSHNILNEELINDVLQGTGSFQEALGPNFEVCTIFAKTSKHLDEVDTAKVILSLRGARKAGLYFLWPTQKKERDGMVLAASLQSLMQRMEAAGVKTSWPHPWSLYEDLVSKSWAPRECLKPELCVPLTTRVTCEGAQAEDAASMAIEELRSMRTRLGGTPLSKDIHSSLSCLKMRVPMSSKDLDLIFSFRFNFIEMKHWEESGVSQGAISRSGEAWLLLDGPRGLAIRWRGA